MWSRDGKQKLQLCVFSLFPLSILPLFPLSILPFPYLGLSSPTSTASPLLLAVISLAPDFAKAANLWFKNKNALRKQAGNLTRETHCVILWRQKGCICTKHQKCSTSTLTTWSLFWNMLHTFFASLTVPPEHDDSWLLKEGKLLYSTVVLWKCLSVMSNFSQPHGLKAQEFQPMEFSRKEYWSGWPFPSAGDLPDPGTESRSPVLQADSLVWATR